jgi:3-deoxy-D-manno-octulosonate 8-phosphate phosphatase (KDO 8-P phosphatase)
MKLIVLDVDGTLTDGGITHHDGGDESKTFSAKDGLILKELHKLGISTLILTGRDSRIVEERGRYMKITDIIQGVDKKREVLSRYLAEHGTAARDAAYIGDDLNDYAAMAMCGFKACPSDAAREICGICDYVSPHAGGHGAVRDIVEHILKREGRWGELLSLFGIAVT